jgi:holo-[acyl-carrier protein] synthase
MSTEAEIGEERALVSLACGVDIVDIQHFTRVLKVGGDRFLQHIYTQAELAYCEGRPKQLAARFAAKEAIAKTLGTGIQGLSWLEMEVLSDHNGRPFVSLYGRARVKAEILGLIHWSISLSHSPTCVIAFVVASTD